jgi:hypothetical protein
MFREARDAQRRRAGVRSKADLDAGIVQELQILRVDLQRLLIDAQLRLIVEHARAPRRIGELRHERGLERVAQEGLRDQLGSLREQIGCFIEAECRHIPRAVRTQRSDETIIDDPVAHAVCQDIDAGLDQRLGVVEIEHMRRDPQFLLVRLVDHRLLHARVHLHRHRAVKVVDPDLDQIGMTRRAFDHGGARLVGRRYAIQILRSRFDRWGAVVHADAAVGAEQISARCASRMQLGLECIERGAIEAERCDRQHAIRFELHELSLDVVRRAVFGSGRGAVDEADVRMR